MNFDKLAAQYELMKIAHGLNDILEKRAQKVAFDVGVAPELSEHLRNAVMKAQEMVRARYVKTYDDRANAKYTLNPEFTAQYQANGEAIPVAPTADPRYPHGVSVKNSADLSTRSGQFVPEESTIIVNITPRVQNPELFIQNLNVRAIKATVASHVSEKANMPVDAQFVRVLVNGQAL